MTKISIITINYNNKEGLLKTIHSVLSQSFKDFEFIIIDGGSTDGSLQIINTYQEKLSYWQSEKDKGIYDAQNIGLSKANGEYCLFLNSGDFLCDEMVLQMVLAQQLDKDLVYGNMRINWANKNISEGILPDTIDLDHMIRDTVWHPVTFIKRSLLRRLGGYNLEYRMVADYDFFFRALIKEKCSYKHVPVLVSEYNTLGLSSDPAKKALELDERKRVISSHLDPERTEKAFRILEEMKPKQNVLLSLLKRFKHKFS